MPKKPQENFRNKLTEALRRIQNEEEKTLSAIQAEVGTAIGRNRHTIEYWRRRNSSLPKDDELIQLTKILFERGGLVSDELDEFLTCAGCKHPPEIVAKIIADHERHANSETNRFATTQTTDSEHLNQFLQILNGAGRAFGRKIIRGITSIPKGAFLLIIVLLLLIVVGGFAWREYEKTGWAIKINQSDDVNLIMLDGHILQANHGTASEWIRLDAYQKNAQDLALVFANLNGPGIGIWDYDLRFDGDSRWREKGGSQEEFTFGTRSKVLLFPDGKWEILDSQSEILPSSLKDHWQADLEGYAIITLSVDGLPVAGSYPSGMGTFSKYDISAFITPEMQHQISLAVWNHKKGEYHWDVTITRNGKVIWEDAGSDNSKQIKEVVYKSFWIDEQGEIIASP